MPRDRPTVADLVAEGRLISQAPDVAALRESLDEAARDIAAADANMGGFGSWADAMLYEAGLRSARAIVGAVGYRVVARDRAHVTTIDAADASTNGAQHAVFVRLHRMRRRRNEFMYEAAAVSTESDLQQARRDVSELASLARHAVERLG